MKCRVDTTKLLVDNTLKQLEEWEIDIYTLSDGEADKALPVFNYLIDLLSNLKSNSTSEYINKILLGIISFLELVNKIKFELSEKEINSINSIENIYNEYLKNNNIEANNRTLSLINQIKELSKDNNLSEKERDLLEKSIKLSEKVDSLKEQIDSLNTKVKLYEDKISKLEIKSEKSSKNNKELENTIKVLKDEIQALKKVYSQVLLEKENLEKIIKSKDLKLNTLNDNINELNQKYNASNEQCIVLKNKLEELNNIIIEYKNKEEKKSREEFLDNYLISKLFEKEYTFFTLFNQLNLEGYNYSKEDLSESLKRIRKKVCINHPKKKTVPIIYKVSTPIISNPLDSTFTNLEIDNITRVYDIVVTADWHIIPEIDINRTMSKLDSLFNYCILNNVGLIINLGDFLDVKPCDNNYTQYSNNMKLLDNIINAFPKDKNVIQAILGGNHDKRMLNLGIDPIKYLEDNRTDIINLGYDDATLNFFNENRSEYIGLHHPNTAGLELGNFIKVREEINKYITNLSNNSGYNRDNIYLDLFGHFHLSRIDASNFYALIPALMKTNGQNTNGALHLKIYFNENNSIDYIVIKSIIPDKTIDPIGEFVYQKK